jgi:hypothetical protein
MNQTVTTRMLGSITVAKWRLTVLCFKVENVALLQLFTACSLEAGTAGDLLADDPSEELRGECSAGRN